MKTPSFALVAIVLLVLPQSTHSQETEQQPQLEELQANIEILKAEIETLREKQNQRQSYELTPVPPPPENRYQDRHSVMRPTPYQNRYEERFHQDYRRDFDGRHFDDRSFDRAFRDREVVPIYVPQPVAVPQPVPVIAQPACGRTYGAGGVYIGPGGWGFDVRGIQFNFGF